MTTLREATAGPVPITLSKGTFRLSQLRDVDWSEFVSWVQERTISIAARCAQPLPADQAQTVIHHATEMACNITRQSPEVVNAIWEPDGLAKIFWLAIRRQHPDLSEVQARGLLTDDDGNLDTDMVEELSNAIQRLYLKRPLSDNGTPKKKRQPAKRRTKRKKR